MMFETALKENDQVIVDSRLRDFLPDEVYDIHIHPVDQAHYPPNTMKYLAGQGTQGAAAYDEAMKLFLPVKTIHGLYFGLPNKAADRPAINDFVADQAKHHSTPLSRGLMLVSPKDDPAVVAAALRGGKFAGIKVYHCYADRPDTMNARMEEFAPEWMWELLHETKGLMMMHLVKDDAIADPENQADIRRLCRRYPNCVLVLAHIARSFNYRNARDGLHSVADLENVVVDTSAVCEADAFQVALKVLGPKRVLWGTDFPISHLRGRAITTGRRFFWLHPDGLAASHQAATSTEMTLIGIESVLCLKEACEDAGLGRGDIEDIFRRNALRILSPHLK